MKRQYFGGLFLLISIIAVKTLAFFPQIIEEWYSNQIYCFISRSLRFLLGSIPFSIGDLGYFILIFLGIRWFWRKRNSWKIAWRKNVLQLLNVISAFYIIFHLFWGLNYYREPLFEKMQIEREYSDTDLLVFTKKLIAKTNAVQFQINRNKNAKIVFPYSDEQVFQMNLAGFKNLAKDYHFFNYTEPSTKKSLFSLPLTYMGFGGYLNPFTNEAQVNYLMPMYMSPTTTCHEMAHQMGYASESECNFIGFLASAKNKNLYFQYSAYSFALRYCLGNWKMRNELIYNQLKSTIHPGILENYKESEAFWKAYKTPIETGFHLFYDTFLKWNQQKDGMEGYSKFVNLMVNYYQNKEV